MNAGSSLVGSIGIQRAMEWLCGCNFQVDGIAWKNRPSRQRNDALSTSTTKKDQSTSLDIEIRKGITEFARLDARWRGRLTNAVDLKKLRISNVLFFIVSRSAAVIHLTWRYFFSIFLLRIDFHESIGISDSLLQLSVIYESIIFLSFQYYVSTRRVNQKLPWKTR